MAWVEVPDNKMIASLKEALEAAQDELLLNKTLKLILEVASNWDSNYIDEKIWKKMYKMSKEYMEKNK